MREWFKTFWQSLRQTEVRSNAEVERISELQQAAVQRRAEYAMEQERSAETGMPTSTIATCRKRVQEAELAYATALQSWNNKQFRR